MTAFKREARAAVRLLPVSCAVPVLLATVTGATATCGVVVTPEPLRPVRPVGLFPVPVAAIEAAVALVVLTEAAVGVRLLPESTIGPIPVGLITGGQYGTAGGFLIVLLNELLMLLSV